MKFIHKLYLTIIILFVSCLAYGQQTDYKIVSKLQSQVYIDNITKASGSMTTLQCSFTQKKIISVLSESVISKGKLLYKKENKLCWEYSTPYLYIFILNGDKVFIRNEKSTSQFDTKSNAVFKEISLLLVNSIKGVGLIDPRKFDVVFFENSSFIKMELTAKNKTLKSIMSNIIFYFDRSTYLVHNIEMVEPSGDSTSIVFSNTVLNQPIDDEKFIIH
jgi:outer membrane lipoprotein carrier protein